MATDLKIGDSVSVPGSMHGTLKYIGPVQGKKGIFAGVQLAPEFAVRGKNSGDVEGKYYFRTSLPGSGIFLPAEKAEKRRSASNMPSTPGQNQGTLNGYNQGGRASSAMGGSLPKPNFSQSIGPGSLVPTPNAGLRAQSPGLRHPIRRESLPRPTSPLRKPPLSSVQTPAAGRLATPKTRPSLGFNRSTIGAPGTIGGGLKSPNDITGRKSLLPGRFGQSVGVSSKAIATPGKVKAPGAPRSETSTTGTNETVLGPEDAFDEEPNFASDSPEQAANTTPTPAVGRAGFKRTSADTEELKRLRGELAEKDRQLENQAHSIAEMERSLSEVQQMMAESLPQTNAVSEEDEGRLPKDVQSLRAALRDKNDKIKALTAEFDANRADFRSTIDTLEMASNETERVYEKRVDDLLEELRGYQERNDDVESVALQFRQLEELVQELEEGLEDARRGEAEARGEVEFLRGEVERSRSEMRRERERSRAGDRLNGVETDGANPTSEDVEELQTKVDQRDNEIRGLKAIIQNLNDNISSRSPDTNKTPRPNGFSHKHSKTRSTNTVVSLGNSEAAENLQQQFRDLETLLDSGDFSEADLREEVQKLRKSVQFGASGAKFNVPGLGISNLRRSGDPQKHISTATSSTASTARPGSMRSNQSGGAAKPYQTSHRRKDTGLPEFQDALQSPVKEEFEDAAQNTTQPDPERMSPIHDTISISGKTDASSNVGGWCEICEESGHDILTCTNMGFSSVNKIEKATRPGSLPVTSTGSRNSNTASAALRPLSSRDAARDNIRRSKENPHPPPSTSMPPPPTPSMLSKDKDGVDRPAPLSMGARPSSSTLNTPVTPGTNANFAEDKAHEQASRPLSSSKQTVGTTTLPVTSTSTSTAATNAVNPTATATVASPTTASATSTKTRMIEGTGDQAGMLAGKESGTIDPNKWCALCERDGHDSVDCPIEDSF